MDANHAKFTRGTSLNFALCINAMFTPQPSAITGGPTWHCAFNYRCVFACVWYFTYVVILIYNQKALEEYHNFMAEVQR